jgi:hypothetical protein
VKFAVSTNAGRTYSFQIPVWLIAAMAVLALFWQPVTAWASDRFDDVPSSNTFHDDIAWMADNGVTVGCNPPANDRFCPDDSVTRGQMAAFMRRLDTKNVFLRPGDQAVDSDKVDGLDVGCPSGTSLVTGVCIETSLRSGESVFDAMRICGNANRRLATAAELGAYRGAGNSLNTTLDGEWTSVIHNDGTSFRVLTVNDSSFGEVAIKTVSTVAPRPFRCVTGPVGQAPDLG